MIYCSADVEKISLAISNSQRRSAELSSEPALATPKLGIGLLYNPALPEFLQNHLDCVDYVAVIPDMFWMDRGVGQAPRYEELESWIELLDWVAQQRPIVSHDIGLSIGSADLFDTDYVEQIGRFCERYHCCWHSDHLSFAQITGPSGLDHNAGLAIPVPYDEEVLEMIAGRAVYVQSAIPIKFLLENNVYYVDIPEQDMTEPEFLNRLTDISNCSLLMDVHNLYANARNHGFDPFRFLDQVHLDRVVEVHIAGGNELAGMYTDSHSGPCPEPVWELLEYVVARASNLCGITFEFHASYYPVLKAEGIRAQLGRARQAWVRSQSEGVKRFKEPTAETLRTPRIR